MRKIVHPRRGFTLFELILVVSLIGLFFIFIVPNLMRKQVIQRDTNITNLKIYIDNHRVKNSLSNDMFFECGANFRDCSLKDKNGTILEGGIDLKVHDATSFKVYDFDPTGKEFEVNFDGIKNDLSQKRTFLRLGFYTNGMTDSFVTFDGNDYSIIDAMSKNVSQYSSLDDAKKFFVKYDKMPINDSKYYFNE